MKTTLKQLDQYVNGLDMAQTLPKIKRLLENKNCLAVIDDAVPKAGETERVQGYQRGRGDGQNCFSSNEEAKQHSDLEEQYLLCFSLYPEDSETGAEQLVHWWIGEDFNEGRNAATTMELAFDYLSELISRCLDDVVQHTGYDERVK
ncbi:hypothetical protein NC653_004220 [Populus alba x Populus x berolinensis]|uniref:Disease resistance protein winged helix domain-containing protein n=2 Tax=Populus TaxID=3689 RepID=A0A4U5QSD3_POPAL|nr:hypothetical protein NC653_004220 [Populus alba x Populus x berolinensis]TKS13912.1 hypothetical protein D5086_0000048700 [Populus alba]